MSPERTAVLEIRHHGPGSARSVVAELDRLQPRAVLIEGPGDADALIALAADPEMQPPIALFAYDPAAPRVSAFWPFATFSPEWQAMRWATAHDVTVRFCDLPAAVFLADDEPVQPELEAAVADAVRADPIARLATAAGYDDPERWWDDVIESRLDGASPFEALTEAMAVLRDDAPPEPQRERRREAQMRQVLRATLKQTDGTVAVVCGAWHAPALSGPLPPATGDAKLLRGMARRKVTLTWVPWTHSRLATWSGYGAGITSPGWYDHLFTAPDLVVTRWLTRVAGVLRDHDLPVSSAHVIEAVRLAETLATLRGRPLAGLAEVTEATRAVLCEGNDAAVEFVQRDLVVGESLGAVSPDAPAVPLEVNLRAAAKTIRLKFDAIEKAIALDLRKPTDLGKSLLLHRLNLLGIRWGVHREDEVRGTGTFRETWTLRWRPEFAVSLVDAALWGTTVVGAATARVLHDARTASELGGVTAAVEQVLLADLADCLPEVLALLETRAALDVDVARLLEAIPALVRAVRYGDVRGTDTASMSTVVDALTLRACAGLPAAVTSLADDAASLLRQRIDATHDALALHAHTPSGPATRERWMATLAELADRRDLNGLLAGRIVRLLVDAGVLDRAEAARRLALRLSIGVTTADKAAWAEGFLSGTGLLLVHDRDLLAVLDDWLSGLDEPDFLDALPLLRRAFGEFSDSERSNIGDSVRRLRHTSAAAIVDAEPEDAGRAQGVLRTVAAILAAR